MRRQTQTMIWIAIIALIVSGCTSGTSESESGSEQGSDPTAATSRTETWTVGPEMMDCMGVAPQECLQIKRQANGDWEHLYSPIEGFEFEPGFTYELEVQIDEVLDPPADASSLRYTLVSEISRTPASPTEPAEAAASLSGTSWRLIELQDGEVLTPTLDDTEILLSFEDESAIGSSGCNRYTGPYKADDTSISFGPAASTRKMCGAPEGVMEQESRYLSMLAEVSAYQASGSTLLLQNQNGDAVAVFESNP